MARKQKIMKRSCKILWNALTKFSKQKVLTFSKCLKKLEDPKSAPKTCWTILNCLIYNKKIPTIPPLFVNGNSVSDFSVKANLFNEFYASICTPIKNSSVLPPLRYRTNKKLSYFSVYEKDIIEGKGRSNNRHVYSKWTCLLIMCKY